MILTDLVYLAAVCTSKTVEAKASNAGLTTKDLLATKPVPVVSGKQADRNFEVMSTPSERVGISPNSCQDDLTTVDGPATSAKSSKITHGVCLCEMCQRREAIITAALQHQGSAYPFGVVGFIREYATLPSFFFCFLRYIYLRTCQLVITILNLQGICFH